MAAVEYMGRVHEDLKDITDLRDFNAIAKNDCHMQFVLKQIDTRLMDCLKGTKSRRCKDQPELSKLVVQLFGKKGEEDGASDVADECNCVESGSSDDSGSS